MGSATLVASADSGGTTPVSAAQTGTSSALPSPIFCETPAVLLSFLYLDTPAFQRLMSHAFKPHELAFLIEAVFWSEDQTDVIRSLRGANAQTFIDVTDEVRSPLFRHREIWSIDDPPR